MKAAVAKNLKKEKKKNKKKDKKKDKELQSSTSNNNLASQSDTTVASPQDTSSKPDSAVHKTSSGSLNNTNGASPEGSKSRTDSLDDANAGSAETPPADIQRGKGSAVGDSYNSATVSSPPDPLLITSVENLDLSKEDSFNSFTFRPTDKETVPPPGDTATQTN